MSKSYQMQGTKDYQEKLFLNFRLSRWRGSVTRANTAK